MSANDVLLQEPIHATAATQIGLQQKYNHT